MKTKVIVFAVLSLTFRIILTTSAQNLVQNSDFSILGVGCPSGTGFGNGGPLGWNEINSADHFHPCSTNNHPTNNFINGCELPLKGTGFAGFLAYNNYSNYYTEYLYQELSVPLIVGSTYYIEFWVSLAENSLGKIYGGKNLGMHLTGSHPHPNTNTQVQFHNIIPQIPNVFPSSSYYTQSNGWQKISGTFIPQSSGIKYLVIGNFDNSLSLPNANPDMHLVTNSTSSYKTSYYFVDNVYVGLSPPADPLPKVTGQSLICNTSNQTYTLSSVPVGATVFWEKSSNLSYVSGQNSTQYTVKRPSSSTTGEGWVKATINSSCGQVSYLYSIWLGRPSVTGSIYGSESASCSNTYIYTLNGGVIGASSWVWENSGHFNRSVVGTTSYLTPQFSGEGYVSIKATNSCGTTYLCQTICVDGCSSGLQTFPTAPCYTEGQCSVGISVYPNPSNDDIILSLEGSEAHVNSIVIIKDDQGRQIHLLEFHGNELRLTKGFLKPGIYYLSVVQKGKEPYTETIVIK